MAGYSSNVNEGYNEQSGINWGKVAGYGGGGILAAGMLRMGATKAAQSGPGTWAKQQYRTAASRPTGDWYNHFAALGKSNYERMVAPTPRWSEGMKIRSAGRASVPAAGSAAAPGSQTTTPRVRPVPRMPTVSGPNAGEWPLPRPPMARRVGPAGRMPTVSGPNAGEWPLPQPPMARRIGPVVPASANLPAGPQAAARMPQGSGVLMPRGYGAHRQGPSLSIGGSNFGDRARKAGAAGLGFFGAYDHAGGGLAKRGLAMGMRAGALGLGLQAASYLNPFSPGWRD